MSYFIKRDLVIKYIIGFITGLIFWLGILYVIPMPEEGYRVIDCGMAEWHPDIPVEIKEECRNRRASRSIST